MNNPFSFSIVIPLYNEEMNIENLVKEIFKYLIDFSNFEIILVNDGSTDNSVEKVESIKNKVNIKLINNNKRCGQSYAIYKGIEESKFNTIITLDGDGQNNPKDIKNLIELYLKNKKTFLVGGIRKKRKDNLIKIVSSKIANKVRNFFLKDNCIDTGCSLKVFDKKMFLNIPFFDGMHRFIPALFISLGSKNLYVDVDHRVRKYGTSKYDTFFRLIRGIKDLFKVYLLLKRLKRKEKFD